MKSSIKILMKFILLTYILYMSPFFDVLPSFLGIDSSFLTSTVYQYDLKENTSSLKERLNLMYVHEEIMLSDEIEEPFTVQKSTQIVQKETINKKVYIYNTHQQEEYVDGKTVVDAGILLANQLQEAGIQVIYESHDFKAWLSDRGLDYNSSYAASNYFLNEAMVQYGGFDLVIDFHRDALPRESAFTTIENKDYAKMMFVVGGLSKNANKIASLSDHLASYVNTNKSGVMKTTMHREAYYNQDLYEKMVLIEVGSDTNTFAEVENSTKLLGMAIIQYLQEVNT